MMAVFALTAGLILGTNAVLVTNANTGPTSAPLTGFGFGFLESGDITLGNGMVGSPKAEQSSPTTT